MSNKCVTNLKALVKEKQTIDILLHGLHFYLEIISCYQNYLFPFVRLSSLDFLCWIDKILRTTIVHPSNFFHHEVGATIYLRVY